MLVFMDSTFSDPAQNFLGFIHYGGEVLFQTLNLEF